MYKTIVIKTTKIEKDYFEVMNFIEEYAKKNSINVYATNSYNKIQFEVSRLKAKKLLKILMNENIFRGIISVWSK